MSNDTHAATEQTNTRAMDEPEDTGNPQKILETAEVQHHPTRIGQKIEWMATKTFSFPLN